MRPSSFLLLGFLFLSGCKTLNEAMVRHMMKEPGMSGEMLDQIREGLQRREQGPPAKRESLPASPFLDQG
ncbi:hypothetical protein [Geomonas edaphica]|uniref:hypothetical protein n=1 Tax=Geomonas edaphica TaxID=2570226 RepID=UPI0010A9075C|nr:hypothetical protein [Geomonas edaphica]